MFIWYHSLSSLICRSWKVGFLRHPFIPCSFAYILGTVFLDSSNAFLEYHKLLSENQNGFTAAMLFVFVKHSRAFESVRHYFTKFTAKVKNREFSTVHKRVSGKRKMTLMTYMNCQLSFTVNSGILRIGDIYETIMKHNCAFVAKNCSLSYCLSN